MSSKPFVLFFNPVKHAQPFYGKLQEVAHTEVVSSTSRQEFFNDVDGKYKDIFAIYRTSASGAVSETPLDVVVVVVVVVVLRVAATKYSIQVAGKFDAEFIEHLPESCKYIFHNGAG